MISTELFTAVKYDPNVYAYTDLCLLLNHMASSLLKNNRIPVWDYLGLENPLFFE